MDSAGGAAAIPLASAGAAGGARARLGTAVETAAGSGKMAGAIGAAGAGGSGRRGGSGMGARGA